jgi:hypothetical protein
MGLDGIKIDLKKSIGDIRLANTTKCNRGLKVYGICELLPTIY